MVMNILLERTVAKISEILSEAFEELEDEKLESQPSHFVHKVQSLNEEMIEQRMSNLILAYQKSDLSEVKRLLAEIDELMFNNSKGSNESQEVLSTN